MTSNFENHSIHWVQYVGYETWVKHLVSIFLWGLWQILRKVVYLSSDDIVGLEAGRIVHLMIQAPRLVRSFILVFMLEINSWPPKFLSFSRWPPSLKDCTVFLLMAYKRNVVQCKMFQWLMFSWRERGNQMLLLLTMLNEHTLTAHVQILGLNSFWTSAATLAQWMSTQIGNIYSFQNNYFCIHTSEVPDRMQK